MVKDAPPLWRNTLKLLSGGVLPLPHLEGGLGADIHFLFSIRDTSGGFHEAPLDVLASTVELEYMYNPDTARQTRGWRAQPWPRKVQRLSPRTASGMRLVVNVNH